MQFCLVVLDFPAARLYSLSSLLSLYASINYIILNLVPFHYLSLLRTLTISATDSLSLKAPVATAFIIKYILFFTLSCILFTSTSFFYLRADDPG